MEANVLDGPNVVARLKGSFTLGTLPAFDIEAALASVDASVPPYVAAWLCDQPEVLRVIPAADRAAFIERFLHVEFMPELCFRKATKQLLDEDWFNLAASAAAKLTTLYYCEFEALQGLDNESLHSLIVRLSPHRRALKSLEPVAQARALHEGALALGLIVELLMAEKGEQAVIAKAQLYQEILWYLIAPNVLRAAWPHIELVIGTDRYTDEAIMIRTVLTAQLTSDNVGTGYVELDRLNRGYNLDIGESPVVVRYRNAEWLPAEGGSSIAPIGAFVTFTTGGGDPGGREIHVRGSFGVLWQPSQAEA